MSRDRKWNRSHEGVRGEENGEMFNGCRVCVWNDKRVLELSSVVVLQHCECA